MSSRFLLLSYVGWATATGDIDYSVKLVFSDDEDDGSATQSGSRGSRDRRVSPPDSVSKASDRSRSDRSTDRTSQSEQRSGAGYSRQMDSERDRPVSSLFMLAVYSRNCISYQEQKLLQKNLNLENYCES